MTLYAPLNLNLHYVTSSSATSSSATSSSSASLHQNISSPPIAPTSTSSTSSSTPPSSSSSSSASLSTSLSTTTTTSSARTPPQLSPPMLALRPDTSPASNNNHNNHNNTTTTTTATVPKFVRPPSPPRHAPSACTAIPIESTAANNKCRPVHLMGAHVASFTVEGRQLICLPQAFELFLRSHVGGLHTVYTKLRRLGIAPSVCNVEQVRSLRGLGAIQPGVNRCKLISRADFEVLYSDCASAGSRPGRPPKRSHGGLVASPHAAGPQGTPAPSASSHAGLGLVGAGGSCVGVGGGGPSPPPNFRDPHNAKQLKAEAANGHHGDGTPGDGHRGNGHRGNGDDGVGGRPTTAVGCVDISWLGARRRTPTAMAAPLFDPATSGPVHSGPPGMASARPLSQVQGSQLFSNGLEHLNGALPFMMVPHHLLPVGLQQQHHHHHHVSMAMSHMTHLGMAAVAQAQAQAQAHTEGSGGKERSLGRGSPSPPISPEGPGESPPERCGETFLPEALQAPRRNGWPALPHGIVGRAAPCRNEDSEEEVEEVEEEEDTEEGSAGRLGEEGERCADGRESLPTRGDKGGRAWCWQPTHLVCRAGL
uniref:Dachshund homolog 1-like isoform X2 n=1 Tax=Petromyzon marinus TaxID=7757 RepID=A0AAJ7UCX3_PETMA|nr:dachshund homolog 1-like isoform X2 [Petromyzon marinus]